VQLARRDEKLESSETKIALGERWGEGKANEKVRRHRRNEGLNPEARI
jgi:hypothetical protein